jgi:hypothetical protein
MTTVTLNEDQQAQVRVGEFMGDIDGTLEPHVLTDKEKTKIVGCRVCKRPCIVTYFMAPAKVACRDHQGRRAPTTVAHDVDKSKESHVLTDKAETKEVPCRHCGRTCVVTVFASASKVACNDCRERAPRPKKTTQYKRNSNGVAVRETTFEIASSEDLEWTDWTVRKPFDFDTIYRPDEKAEHSMSVGLMCEARALASQARRDVLVAEDELARLPGNAPEAKVQKLEDKRDRADQTAVAQTDLAHTLQEKASRLARIAYVRGAIAARWKIERIDPQHWLSRGESRILIPHDFLDQAGYRQAQLKVDG